MIKLVCMFKDSSALDHVPEEYKEMLEKWVEWSEYITVEFDTETQTAKVLTVDEARTFLETTK